ncbi:rhomboid family intramembrane serine protease [Singulisphaera acidiphila]|uniref:Putative membrane protein n=1 Tax=Singulisphaera acidiphila (strain ATCC BAA-1392 / DSM 18658 / VKM B-2454 / MOB10) TaxID=886293 RepID=L0DJG3_SINAD|nr:rhomboid family intramembrane serine protease [Singulisphaera acidiphila]AGA29524.1 putative membrane protein [Singulisphaera acidiphila DSM 18658]
MIVIPTGTDAPIYHWPYVTVVLIVLNVALLFVIPPASNVVLLDENDEVIESVEAVSLFDRYALALGDGRLHPLQWVTHNFLHYGLGHLAGNMLFLWAFGIVVEGKLGPIKYLLTYLAIGTLHGACLQLLLMKSGMDGHAAGASAVVYGLLATCMIWAPRNELNCTVILLIGFRAFVYHWDLYYTTVALFYIGQQIFGLVVWGSLGNQVMVTEIGHLSGAFWGAVVAFTLLKAGLVDCEGWDLFSLRKKRATLTHEWNERGERLAREKQALRSSLKANLKAKARDKATNGDGPVDGPSAEDRAATAVRRVRTLIDKGDIAGALVAYDKSARTLVNWPTQAELFGLIKALSSCGAESDAIRLMRDHCRYYPDASTRVRLKLAQVLIRDRQRPAAALRVLEEITPGSLPADLETARQKLALQANRMCQDGVLELEEDD